MGRLCDGNFLAHLQYCERNRIARTTHLSGLAIFLPCGVGSAGGMDGAGHLDLIKGGIGKVTNLHNAATVEAGGRRRICKSTVVTDPQK